jgi:PadR family transcriptional regulator PadR
MDVMLASRCRWLVAPGRWKVRGRIERFIEPAVLLLLAGGPRHGYELKEQVTTLVGSDRADVANLYRLLRQLELEGIVRSSWVTAGSGPARRVYRLTTPGRRLLDQWADALRVLDQSTHAFLARYDRVSADPDHRARS